MKPDIPVVENRRARLANWIETKFDNSQAKFIRSLQAIDEEDHLPSSGEISWLLKDKSFGEKKARKLEKQAGMPDRWLDQGVSQINDNIGKLSDDPLQERILLIFKASRDAMDSLNCPYSQEQLIQFYKRALDHGMDEQINEEQLIAIIKILVAK